MSTGNPEIGSIVNCDALIVGAGFSGTYALYRLRKLGLDVKVFESGNDFGGVWYWNRYPGARVDSEWPFYQLSIPEVWKGFNFSQRFPDHTEIRKYFEHLDKTLDLRKDVEFGAHVNSAEWKDGKWHVTTMAGHTATCKYLFLCSGLLHRRHYPDFPGFDNYKGIVHHSGYWPEDFDVSGKKVAVIGAGATSVQIVQELTKQAANLTMMMRRPSICLPARNREVTTQEQTYFKPYYGILFKEGRVSNSGFPAKGPNESIWDVSQEDRETYFEELWKYGSFHLALANYKELLLDLKANRIVYDFWAKKTRERMNDPIKRDLMAPLEPPYPFFTKRPPLETDYYECLDMKHVTIADIKKNPIKTFTETGIILEDGTSEDFDVVVLATGFDSFSGSLTTMGLKNKDGIDIKDVWKDSIATYLGMLISGFPNAFMVYSPHAPTALSNGPTILECQIDFVCDTIKRMEEEKHESIEAQEQAQEEWKKMVETTAEMTLLPMTQSWWTGANIPGKKVQQMTYVAGIGSYEKDCREKLDGWKGFTLSPTKV